MMRPPVRLLRASSLLLLVVAAPGWCGEADAGVAPVAAAFDAVAATDAYLASVPREQRSKTDAYFEGGYWLQLVDFLVGLAVAGALLVTGLSRRMRERAERRTGSAALQTWLYWGQYVLVTTVLVFPLSVYEGYFREHQYGLSNQSFGEWLGDEGKSLGVALVFVGLLVTALYAVVRRVGQRWAVWGAVTAIAGTTLMLMIVPVYISPLFNDYVRLDEPVVKGRVLELARAQGVPTQDVWLFDASRQSKRVSANVSGLGATMRVSLNDNLLNRCSAAEIEAVMGHELGHYVLHHIPKSVLFLSVVIVLGFAFVRWGFERLLARFGERWGVSGVADPAGLPLALALFSVFSFVLTPVSNSWTRGLEAEADLFGINASGQPDGHAKADLMLGEYRKLDPSPLEELVFFDHPSGRSRISMAMRWKAEHLADAARNAEVGAADDARRGYSPASAAEWLKTHSHE